MSETAEVRRSERVRLGIQPAQQRAIDRAAVKIAASAPDGGLAAPQVIEAPAFERLLEIVRPPEGRAAELAQAIVDRIAWLAEQQGREDEDVLRLMMEMD